MDLADVLAQLKKNGLAWYYIDQLDWSEEKGIIKARPRWPLTQAAFDAIKKAFKRLGGKFVSSHGQSWFELVLKEAEQNGFRHATSNNQTSKSIMTQPNVSPVPGSVLLRLQARLERLVNAGSVLLNTVEA